MVWLACAATSSGSRDSPVLENKATSKLQRTQFNKQLAQSRGLGGRDRRMLHVAIRTVVAYAGIDASTSEPSSSSPCIPQPWLVCCCDAMQSQFRKRQVTIPETTARRHPFPFWSFHEQMN
uniref:Uncharacterized protein n=1 Tax=Physcomitrium patens TaxID=3218 RepID=A0A2K1KAR7_PHYPA|nr:hypothetical protein PHYPA_010045 [Physcomitrium patens]